MTLLTVCAIIVAMVIATLLGAIALKNVGSSTSDDMLLLLCKSGERNLDAYFESVEQSVEMVTAYVESDLDGVETEQLQAHLERVKDIFERLAYKTSGVLTYYYRVDPAVSETAKGFWFVNLDGEGFVEHEVTDITQYDTEDTTRLVWFTVPKATGRSIWLPPYITDNLDVRVISYNVPIYWQNVFVGVLGIEIDYSTMADQVDSLTLYDNGYAFINDAEGTIIYHPRIDVTSMEEEIKAPDGLLRNEAFIRYTFEGVEKRAVWLPLKNGMRLNVTVPLSEINAGWHSWIYQIFFASVVILTVFILITMRLAKYVTKPLQDLAEVAERVNSGDYDCRLDYDGEDEIGLLTRAFNRLTAHLKSYISDLNDLAYADALTSVHNKGAFDIYVQNLQAKLKTGDKTEFAVCIFDCNDLKKVNDGSGHEKGDLYLKDVSTLICEVFSHSPVFRIGGDEFAVVLQNADYAEREELLDTFDRICAERRAKEEEPWRRLDIARGIAIYDNGTDDSVSEVARRADKLMYENKWKRKHGMDDQI